VAGIGYSGAAAAAAARNVSLAAVLLGAFPLATYESDFFLAPLIARGAFKKRVRVFEFLSFYIGFKTCNLSIDCRQRRDAGHINISQTIHHIAKAPSAMVAKFYPISFLHLC